VDRCALFVDAGYALADGAMAVHGTRRRESVSWDYAGLLQLLSGLARERSGLPLLRCYWYEATVEGRRNAEHDTLADLPGVKLRLAKMRPGRREGVEGEIHRDLTTLARNKAVTDAMVVSAEEDLAQVIADVQDLGMRVTLLHIAVDGGDWTISRALRQECDDIVEISSAHLRPFVELISGAEPPRPDEQDGAPVFALRPTANGHGRAEDTVPYPPASQEPADAPQAPWPVLAEPPDAGYQHTAPPSPQPQPEEPAAAAEFPAGVLFGEPADAQPATAGDAPEVPGRPDMTPVQEDAQPVPQDAQPAEQEVAPGQDHGAAPPETVLAPAVQYLAAPPDLAVIQPEQAQVQPSFRQEYAPRPDWAAGQGLAAHRDVYGAPVAVPAPHDEQPAVLPAARGRGADFSGYNPGALREQPPRDAFTRDLLPAESGPDLRPVPSAPPSAQVHRLPTRGNGQPAPGPGPVPAGMSPGGQPAAAAGPPVHSAPAVPPTAAHLMPAHPALAQPGGAQPGIAEAGISQPGAGQLGMAQPPAGPFLAPPPEAGQPLAGQPPLGEPGGSQPGVGQPGVGQPSGGQPVAPVIPAAPGAGYAAIRNGSYTGPRPVFPGGSGGSGGGAPAGSGGSGAVGGPGGVPGQSANPSGPIPPAGPSGLVPAAGSQAGPGGQPGPGFGVPSLTASAGPPAGPVNGIGQHHAYSQAGGGAGGSGVPVGPLGPAGPAYPGTQPGVSLAEAVESAHQEGQEFGESVARDAPALWLEAVLARKPRMPSDLEARLLQGSALPIDFLLHDEVRHALRRGFWDALERARR